MKHDTHEDVSVCEECGASVYKEHLTSGISRYESGRLLCSHCLSDFESEQDAAARLVDQDLEPIELDADEDDDRGSSSTMSSSRIHSASEATLGHSAAAIQYVRPLDPNGPSASRCRTFHCRLSDGAIDFMNHQINEWLDQNAEISIKFVTTTIGLFEGKHTEQNLIMTVFY
jgi:hypothetical protein